MSMRDKLLSQLNNRRVRRHFNRLSMRRKMFLGYSIPVLLISTVILTVGYFVMLQRYTERLRFDMEQFMAQTDEQLTRHFQSLNYLTQLISTEKDLRDILGEKEYGKKEDAVDIFWEFHQLDSVFQSIELANNEYRVGMYIDDDLRYANNNFYLYPISRLEAHPDYDEIMEDLEYGSSVYTILQDRRSSEPDSTGDHLAQLTPLKITAEDGEERSFIIKTEMNLESIERILGNAKLTEGSILYLEDDRGRRMAYSGAPAKELLELYDFRTPYKLSDWDATEIGARNYFYLERISGWRSWRLIALIPVSEYRAQQLFLIIWLIAMIGGIIAAVSLISSRIARYYSGRIGTLNGKMLGLSGGTGGARLALPETGSSDEMDELYRNFDFMLDEVDSLMKEQYRLGRSISNAEMRALQAQINPHFLYNTLDLINWGALDHGADDVAQIARSLGQFYRLSLNHGRSAITIRDELKHVESYVAIENAHYDGAVHLVTQVPEDLLDYACLNITLQPFVENCIVHGIAEYSDLKECNILIRAEKEGEDILFYVEDDGHGIDPALAQEIESRRVGESGHGYGISNINFRIKLCYGEEYGIHYLFGDGNAQESAENLRMETDRKCPSKRKGTRVRIRIKALKIEELEKLLQ